MISAEEAAWMAQWRNAERELAELHRKDLRELTDEAALQASEVVLSLAASTPIPPERLNDSGLVAQQAIFHRRSS